MLERRSVGSLLAWLALGAGSLATASPARAQPAEPASVELTVSAAISLKGALEEVAGAYRSAHPHVSLALNIGASGSLQQQIEQGAPVDVFVAAAPKQLDALEAKGLLAPGTRRNLWSNAVVLIAPRGAANVKEWQDLGRAGVRRVALAEPRTVPAGAYARDVLTHFGLLPAVDPKTVHAKDVRQVLTWVEAGEVDAGVVYATDARSSAEVQVVAPAPPGSHAPVLYPGAVIRASRHPLEARTFLEFLAGPAARRLFERYGFESAG